MSNFNLNTAFVGGPSGGMSRGTLDNLKRTFRRSGYSDQVTEEIAIAMNTFAGYGSLGIIGLNQVSDVSNLALMTNMQLPGGTSNAQTTTASSMAVTSMMAVTPTASQKNNSSYVYLNTSCNLSAGSLIGSGGSGRSGLGSSGSTGSVLIINVEESNTCPDTDSKYGTITDIVEDTLVVTTQGNSALLSIAESDVSHRPSSEYCELGKRLSNHFATQSLTHVRTNETFWRRKLRIYEPTMFSRQRMNVVSAIIDVSMEFNVRTIVIPLPVPEMNRHSPNNRQLLLASFVAFIGRITCNPTVSLGILVDKAAIHETARPFYICPGMFTVDLQQQTHNVIDEIYEMVKKYREAQYFHFDAFNRSPDLCKQRRTPHHNIVIGMTPTHTSKTSRARHVLNDCSILLLFNEEGDEMHLLYKDKHGEDFRHIRDVLQHFPTFLRSVTDNGLSQPLYKINLIPKEEPNQWYPQPGLLELSSDTVYDVFRKQCLSTPSNTALRSSSAYYSYAECNDLVGKISSLFETLNDDERIIGIHLPNSMAYVVSLLGVLKAGRAFLPLPIDYPEERISFVMRDAKVYSILTSASKRAIMVSRASARTPFEKETVLVDRDEIILIRFTIDERDNVAVASNGGVGVDRIQTCGTEISGIQQDTNANDKDTCYIMYTSGSTGKPKGVRVGHAGVINLARAQIKLWSLGPRDVIAQFVSIGFDGAISEIFTALHSGATLVTLSDIERLGHEFIRTMNKLNVNTITLAPSALNIYSPSDLPKLTKVITAGEACSLGTALKWTADNNKTKFFNAYGPTETTVCATCYEFEQPSLHNHKQDLPIGKAIPGVYVYLFDDFMNPLPPGLVGEIYVGGIGVSKGYIGHAAHLNPERFVQNPMTDEPCLLYKTGDHGLQSNDGNIAYIGRLDNIIKIRGQRVDLSEIEQVLIQYTKIELAVVVVHKCIKSEEVSIAAYVAPSFVDLSELKEYLTKALPKYMVPTFIRKMEVSDFPMTMNGKIDRKRLETDESVHEQKQFDGVRHLKKAQLAIAKLWCVVLKLDESVIDDFHRQTSFSELGGNSLQLVLLQRTLADRLHVQLSFTDLRTADTIEQFSDVVKSKKSMPRISSPNTSHDLHELRRQIMRDSLLDPTILPQHARRDSAQFGDFSAFGQRCSAKYPRNVLISGVTGFLGAYLLSELLEQTSAHVYCMVRESTEARGPERITENLQKYNLWNVKHIDRISAVISDLSQKNLGIAPDIYNALCNVIDVVFMNAAKMNLNTDYDDHKVTNVDSTIGFIKFAVTGKQKYIFATSSLSVFLFPERPEAGKPQHCVCYESEFVDDPCSLEGGYGKSKWASERLVLQALKYLPSGAIFRPARISGSSLDGAGPRNDLFASTLIGMTRFGFYPDMDFPYDLTPVDYVAKAMVEISLKICKETGEHERVYHLFNRQIIPFRELFKDTNLNPLPLEQWRRHLTGAMEDNRELLTFSPFFQSEFWDKAVHWPIFDTANTDHLTSAGTKACMKPSGELLSLYKSYFGLDV